MLLLKVTLMTRVFLVQMLPHVMRLDSNVTRKDISVRRWFYPFHNSVRDHIV